MSKLTNDDIRKIAHLARLQINDDDIPEYSQNLSKILDFIEQLNSVDTSNIEPMAHPMDVTQRLREDEVTEKNQRDYFQKLTPFTEAGLYLVPQVIE